MSYVSLYRKYRSQTFSDLIGQDHVVRTIQNGIQRGKISHSYLFTGPRGTGKTSTARLLAKALCCEQGPIPEPDNTCEICRSITAGNCIDVIEMDAASEGGVDDIREHIVEAVEYRPMVCRYKVFIIDEVHDLSPKAFDALLKTVEEPPPHIVFILATTEFNKVPLTIRSRCQKHEFHRGDLKDLISRLDYVLEGEGVKAEPSAVAAIARMADGGYRDALSLLEQVMLTNEDTVSLESVYDQLGMVSEEAADELLMAIRQSDAEKIVSSLQEMAGRGRDPRAVLESLMYRLADLTRALFESGSESTDAPRLASLHEQAVQIGKDALLRLRGQISEAHHGIRDVSLPRLWLESELLRISLPTVERRVAVAAVETKAPAAAPPTPKVSPPTPKPRTESKPPVDVEVQEQAPEPEVVLTGDSDFDQASAAWRQAKKSLGDLSPLMKLRLRDAELIAREGAILAIQMERTADKEWIEENPKRTVGILKAVREKLGDEIEIRFVVRKRDEVGEEPVAVELTLERHKLEAAVKEILTVSREPSEGNT